MEKRIRIAFGLLIIYCFVLLSIKGFSQDIGATYWFKKGINEKDNDKKIEYYQNAVKENPQFVEAHYNLALSYLINKDLNKAQEALNNALSANPNALNNVLKSNILNRLGSTYRKLDRFAEAEKAFQAALDVTTDNKFKAVTLYELGQTKISQGEFDTAANYFRQGMRISPEDRASFETGIQLAKDQQKVHDLYQQGLTLVKNQKLVEAKDVFNQVLAINPNHEEARKQIEDVIPQILEKNEVRDKQLKPLYAQALVYMNDGNWSDAIKQFEKINSIQANYSDVNKLLAQARERQNQQLLTDQKIDNFYAMGVENFDSSNYMVALANFEKVSEIDPKFKDIDARIQATKKEISRVNELMAKMPKRNEATFTTTDENFQIESSTYSSNDLNSQQLFAEKSRQMDAAIDSQLVKNYYQEALDLMQQQQWQRAMILFEKIKLIKPNYKSTEFLLSQVKQNIEAASMAANETPTQSTSSTLLFALFGSIIALPIAVLVASPITRARYYILLKKYDKAREIYERMLTKRPNNIKLYITLANIYINENRVDEIAIRVFERAIQYNDNLKVQLEPIVSRYYLQKSKSSDTPTKLIQGALKEELKRMGN
jgi:tetratricopeptide (TPR) repeat protein